MQTPEEVTEYCSGAGGLEEHARCYLRAGGWIAYRKAERGSRVPGRAISHTHPNVIAWLKRHRRWNAGSQS